MFFGFCCCAFFSIRHQHFKCNKADDGLDSTAMQIGGAKAPDFIEQVNALAKRIAAYEEVYFAYKVFFLNLLRGYL